MKLIAFHRRTVVWAGGDKFFPMVNGNLTRDEPLKRVNLFQDESYDLVSQ
jgi:hypothetical protein